MNSNLRDRVSPKIEYSYTLDKLVCISENFLSSTAVSKIICSSYYFVIISVLILETVKDDTSYTFNANRYELQLQVQAAAGFEVQK